MSGRIAWVSDAIDAWVDKADSSLGGALRLTALMLVTAAALLVVFIAVTGFIIGFFGLGSKDYGQCLDYHVEYSKGYHNVCDVWEFPNGRSE